MIRRVAAGLVAVAVLVGLIAYSQLTPEVDHVSGFVEAEDIRLGSRVGGRVAAVMAEEGDRIAKGQTLLRLEPYDLNEQLAKARANLASREAEFRKLTDGFRKEEVAQARAAHAQAVAMLDRLKTGPRPQEITAARARLAQAEAELRLANRNLTRVQSMAQRDAATEQEIDRAVEALTVAENQTRVRQLELELLELGTREEEIREAEARVEEARQAMLLAEEGYRPEEVDQAKSARDAAAADLAAIERRLDELEINSPVDGVVESLDLEPGDVVGAGAPVLSVLDTSQYWVRAYVPQRRMDLKVGHKVRVTVDSFPDRDFEAELSYVARQAEFTPSNVQTPEDRAKLVYRIKATLLAPTEGLRPGVTADVWLDQSADSPDSPGN